MPTPPGLQGTLELNTDDGKEGKSWPPWKIATASSLFAKGEGL